MLTLREMRDLAIGEVYGMQDLIRKGQNAKPPRSDYWVQQHERILLHRQLVVRLISQQIELRKTEGEAA